LHIAGGRGVHEADACGPGDLVEHDVTGAGAFAPPRGHPEGGRCAVPVAGLGDRLEHPGGEGSGVEVGGVRDVRVPSGGGAPDDLPDLVRVWLCAGGHGVLSLVVPRARPGVGVPGRAATDWVVRMAGRVRAERVVLRWRPSRRTTNLCVSRRRVTTAKPQGSSCA
jgi:hypothetical protein